MSWRVEYVSPLDTRHCYEWEKNCQILETETWLRGRDDVVWSDRSFQCLLIRIDGYPPIDLWPSTGRWRVSGKRGPTQEGGMRRFWKWFLRQKEPKRATP